jgi:FkbM family methyltransferase
MTSAVQSPDLPVVNSEFLFRALSNVFRASLVLDVGSYDGTNALRFCRHERRVVALEANPANAGLLASNPAVTSAGIDVRHCAAWKEDGTVSFNVVEVPEPDDWHRKISSTRPRNDSGFPTKEVTVEARRLDTFVAELDAGPPESIALWIDVEGAAYEVLQGIEQIAERVCAIHVEVELQQFWEAQKLWPDVRALMRDAGFVAVARRPGDLQFDVVFVNSRFARRMPVRWRAVLVLAWLRMRVAIARRNLLRLFARQR